MTLPHLRIDENGEHRFFDTVEDFERWRGEVEATRGRPLKVSDQEDATTEERLEAVLRFVLSTRAAFITGQPFHVTALAADAEADEEIVFFQGVIQCSGEGRVDLRYGAVGAAEGTALIQPNSGCLVINIGTGFHIII